MAEKSLCSDVAAILKSASPSEHAASSAGEIVEHLERCPDCVKLIDEAEDPAPLFEFLARQDSPTELKTVDQLLSEEKRREQEIRRAIEDSLFPALRNDAVAELPRRIVEAHGAMALAQAIEATSLLARRHLPPASRRGLCLLHPDGSIGTQDFLLNVGDIAIEIARFTQMWANPDAAEKKLKPHEDARALVGWFWDATDYIPSLFRHFFVVPLASEDKLLLELPPSLRKNSLFERWSPAMGKVLAGHERDLAAIFRTVTQTTGAVFGGSGLSLSTLGKVCISHPAAMYAMLSTLFQAARRESKQTTLPIQVHWEKHSRQWAIRCEVLGSPPDQWERGLYERIVAVQGGERFNIATDFDRVVVQFNLPAEEGATIK